MSLQAVEPVDQTNDVSSPTRKEKWQKQWKADPIQLSEPVAKPQKVSISFGSVFWPMLLANLIGAIVIGLVTAR